MLRVLLIWIGLYNGDDVYAECSKIAKNRPKSTWVVFLESNDFAISKNSWFLFFYYIVHQHIIPLTFFEYISFWVSFFEKYRHSIGEKMDFQVPRILRGRTFICHMQSSKYLEEIVRRRWQGIPQWNRFEGVIWSGSQMHFYFIFIIMHLRRQPWKPIRCTKISSLFIKLCN